MVQEQELRSALVTTLGRGCVYSGSGNLITLNSVDSGARAMLCYYCVVRDEGSDDTLDPLSHDPDDPDGGAADASYFSSDHVLCFLREFPSADVELDLFKPELDAYCIELARTGVLRACRNRPNDTAAANAAAVVNGSSSSSNSNNSSSDGGGASGGSSGSSAAAAAAAAALQAASPASPASPTPDPRPPASPSSSAEIDPTLMMADWYRRNVEFLPRCVAYFGARLHLVIHAALMALRIDVVGGTDDTRADIRGFFSALSLSALLHHPDVTTNEHDGEGGGGGSASQFDQLKQFIDTEFDETATLLIAEDGTSFEIQGDFGKPTEFCRRWAMAMEVVKDDAMRLKRVISNHGLQVIQEINTVKGLLNRAEASHYALYNAHDFLGNCRAPARAILHSVCRSVRSTGRQGTKDVLAVLLEFERERTPLDDTIASYY